MKNIFYFLLACFIFSACEDYEELGFEDYYDAYLINDVLISSDKNIFFEGDPPVTFTAVAFNETEVQIENFDFIIVINDTDTLEGKTFTPTETGRYFAHAVANNVESPVIPIDFIKPSDINNLELNYQGYRHLTTEPWSVTGDFILTTNFPNRALDVEITKSNIPLTISDGRTTSNKEGIHFSEAGTYQVYVDFNGVKTESINIVVREAIDYEEINIPVVFHYVNQNPSIDQIDKAIASYNDIFNNKNIQLNADDFLAQWDNPNWVNAGMSFSLVPMSEIESLAFDGVNLINTTNSIETNTEFDVIARNNLFDPNKYLNIFVTEDINNTISVRPIVEGPAPVVRGIAHVETAESQRPYILNVSEPYNSFTMGEFWGLLKTEGCTDDYAEDTYSYIKDAVDPYRSVLCDGGAYVKNFSRSGWDARLCYTRSDVYTSVDTDSKGNETREVIRKVSFDCATNSNPSFFFSNNIMDRDGTDNYKQLGTLEFGIDRFRTIITFDQRERMRTVIEGARYRPTKKNR